MTDRIQEIRARCDTATPGPWETALDVGKKYYIAPPSYGIRDFCYLSGGFDREQDASFIAHAREDIPYLLSQLAASQRRAQDARNELCQRCGRYKEAHKGACDGCRWKENSDGFEELLERWGNGDSDNAVCATALAAPREQAERSRGCEYCDDNFKFWQTQISGEFPNVRFCPMCGRRLEAESINAGTIGGEIVQWALRELEVREDD